MENRTTPDDLPDGWSRTKCDSRLDAHGRTEIYNPLAEKWMSSDELERLKCNPVDAEGNEISLERFLAPWRESRPSFESQPHQSNGLVASLAQKIGA